MSSLVQETLDQDHSSLSPGNKSLYLWIALVRRNAIERIESLFDEDTVLLSCPLYRIARRPSACTAILGWWDCHDGRSERQTGGASDETGVNRQRIRGPKVSESYVGALVCCVNSICILIVTRFR